MMERDALVSWLGKSKTAARRTMSAYIKRMPEGVRITSDAKLDGLCRFHPSRKFPSPAVFVLHRRPPYFSRALCIESCGGGYVDCSWIKCLENLYGAYSVEKNARAYTLAALRNEAFASAAMRAARSSLGSACARCKEPCSKLVVDHDGKPFAQIVDEFLGAKRLQLADLRVRGSKNAGFRLRKHGREWRKFHDANAVLVGLCAKCNGSLGSRGYRHTKAAGAPADDDGGAEPPV